MEKLVSVEEIIEKLKEMRRIECVKGIDYPCIACLECAQADFHEYTVENVLLKWTANSAIVSIKLPLRDELDEFLLKELLRELSRTFRFILEKPEENYHISLFIRYTDMLDAKLSKQIETFILKDKKEIMSMITQGRIMIKDWARYVREKLHVSKVD